MTDDLIARLRANNTWYDTAAADALEAQARRIAELLNDVNHAYGKLNDLNDCYQKATVDLENDQRRIAELEKISYMADEHAAKMMDTYRARIAELEAALNEAYSHAGKVVINATTGIEWEHPTKARQQLAGRIWAEGRAALGDKE